MRGDGYGGRRNDVDRGTDQALNRTSDQVRRHGFASRLGFWLRAFGCLAALPCLAALSDSAYFEPAAAYAHAQQTLIHGHLEAAQAEADRGYQWAVMSGSEWGRRFQILEARTMLWRRSDEELLQFLAEDSGATLSSTKEVADESVQVMALKAMALTHLERLDDAGNMLRGAESVCAARASYGCGEIQLAQGLLSLRRGELGEAKRSFLEAVGAARRDKDAMLEGTAQLGLGSTVSQQEHFDEALDFYKSAQTTAAIIDAEDVIYAAVSGQAWQYDQLGNSERALELYKEAEAKALALGDGVGQVESLTDIADVYAAMGQLGPAQQTDLQAIKLAKRKGYREQIIDASMDVAQAYVREGRPDEAERYADEAWSFAQESGNKIRECNYRLLLGEAAALRHDWSDASAALDQVIASPESPTSLKWTAEHALGKMYEEQGNAAPAESAYKSALSRVETARADLKREGSQLTFLANAESIYDDYIHFLVTQGRPDDALQAADWSRARTLQQGLGAIPVAGGAAPSPLRANEIARKAKATLLFYWLGERQSYLWAISAEKTMLIPLPAKGEIVRVTERYRRALIGLAEPVRSGSGAASRDGRELYEMLVAPAARMIAPDRPVVLLVDGELGQLNFETLLAGSLAPHYWIEDATIVSAPSIRLLGAVQPAAKENGRLLILGDSLPPSAEFPRLPMASLEMAKVERRFLASDEAAFQGPRATPSAYLKSRPEQFSYIHFVTHGTASRTDPLESAVILSGDGDGSGGGEESYKLYAREILRHPIDARLVTISACNSSGAKSYAGEGLVGLSWAFLRAGAHNAIGSLWEVSDASTPQLMDRLYLELQEGKPPATALRDAKLSLLRAGGNYSRPFYWAPFQLYSGR